MIPPCVHRSLARNGRDFSCPVKKIVLTPDEAEVYCEKICDSREEA
jgi:hypothetical protein